MDSPLLGGSKDAKIVKIDNFKYQQTFNKKKKRKKSNIWLPRRRVKMCKFSAMSAKCKFVTASWKAVGDPTNQLSGSRKSVLICHMPYLRLAVDKIVAPSSRPNMCPPFSWEVE